MPIIINSLYLGTESDGLGEGGREGEPLEGEKSGRADSLSGTQQQQGSWKATKQRGGRVEEPGEGKTILHAE